MSYRKSSDASTSSKARLSAATGSASRSVLPVGSEESVPIFVQNQLSFGEDINSPACRPVNGGDDETQVASSTTATSVGLSVLTYGAAAASDHTFASPSQSPHSDSAYRCVSNSLSVSSSQRLATSSRSRVDGDMLVIAEGREDEEGSGSEVQTPVEIHQ